MNPNNNQNSMQAPANFWQGNANQGIPNTSASNNVNQSSGYINASQLGTSAPQIPNPVNTNTAQMNLGTQASTFTEGIAGNQQMQQEEVQAQQVVTPTNSRQGILDKISSLLGVQSTQGQVTQDIFAGEGVQAKKDLVRNLENEALAKDRAYTKQAEKIRMNTEGKLESGVQIDLNNLERQRNSELADLAIQSKVAQGNYQSAFEIADAKVKAQFEPIENQIKSLQTLYGLYADDMTESEKMQAQAKIQEQQADLDFKRQKELINYRAQIDIAREAAETGGQGYSVMAGQAPKGKPDFMTAGFATRAVAAKDILNNLETSKTGFVKGLLSGGFRKSGNRTKPAVVKQYEQAMTNFVTAVLRKESGASISPEEFQLASQQYFAQPGDDNLTVLQKQQARTDAVNSLIGASGTAYNGVFLPRPTNFKNASFGSDTNFSDDELQALDETFGGGGQSTELDPASFY